MLFLLLPLLLFCFFSGLLLTLITLTTAKVPRENSRIPGAVVGIDGETVLTSPVRKERRKKTKKEIAEEAAKVISQADQVGCVANDKGTIPEKFYTLPNRRRPKETPKEYASHSLDRRSHKRRISLELQPPKKPPRTFAAISSSHQHQLHTTNNTSKPSIFDIFKKQPAKKSNLRRSVSDASALRSKAFGPVDVNSLSKGKKRADSDDEEGNKKSNVKKQLSPIIEVNQREDYFALEGNKENIEEASKPSVTDQLKTYIEEVDEALYKETGIRITTPPPKKTPEPIIIDLDKAENISTKKKHKLNFGLGKKLKALAQKRPKKQHDDDVCTAITPANVKDTFEIDFKSDSEEDEAVATRKSPVMIHSSQQPPEKLPLTKGKTVNSMVKRLSSSDACSSPPPTRTNVLIMPNMSVQHNNNQPFSYTRGISPDKYRSHEDLPKDPPNLTKPVIYAQVVCGANGVNHEKQTIHTTYNNGRRQPQSDSDEGLGGEDSLNFNNRKYDMQQQQQPHDKFTTKFGERTTNNQFDSYQSEIEKQLLDEIDKYKAESPILPKYRSPASGFSSSYIMERGRADGMDAKRRESLTEQEETGHNLTFRGDLSARRDLLESRINRRLNDKNTPSPEYYPNNKHSSSRNNLYVSEKSSKYYRSGSTSPVGFQEKYVSETKTDAFGERHTESRTKKYFGDPADVGTGSNFKYTPELLLDPEPKSLSDYRSSPENHLHSHPVDSSQGRSRYHHRSTATDKSSKLLKDKNLYRSTPEIHHRNPDSSSLPRNDSGTTQRFRSERFLNREESDRRTDRLVDSGIENDFRRDSSENYPPTRPMRAHRDLYNESEDEGFASSLLITNEKQHSDGNHLRRSRKDYDSDVNSRDEFYRQGRHRYIPRERSVDDGSHFDPRLDKDVLRGNEKKPPKPEKRSGLDKVKSLFTRDKKKDKTATLQKKASRQPTIEREPSPTDYRNRRRLSTPSPSRDTPKRLNSLHSSWFKSLDRLTKRKPEKRSKEGNFTSTEDESPSHPKLSSSTSNLRFFGDTDQESNADSVRGKPVKKRPGLRSQSTRDLHQIAEEKRKTAAGTPRKGGEVHHKSLTNISETDRDVKGSGNNLKPPMSPTSRYVRDLGHHREDRRRHKKPEISSVESSTEGDSSQQSQRSIVYLHAATVGDIPGPGYLRSSRALSREDLTSNGSSFIQPQVKTLSRSFSVLAPWKPRHQRESMDIDYTQYNKGVAPSTKNGKYEQKASRTVSNRNDNSTLKKKAQESRRGNYQQQQQQTLNRKSRSKENLSGMKPSRQESARGSTSTLYKKKDKLPRENSRYIKDDRKLTSKSQSVESITRRSREEARDVSRSVSMPRDSDKSAGWFKKTKKSNHQRL